MDNQKPPIFLPGQNPLNPLSNPSMSNQEMRVMLLDHHRQLRAALQMIAQLQKQVLGLARIQNISPTALNQIFHDEQANMDYFNAVRKEETALVEADKLKEKEKDDKLKKILTPTKMTPEMQADLQAFCDKYQGHITGTFTPVAPAAEPFDLTVQATPTDAGAATAQ